eukprot:m.75276 g.75276  ORF g.75276 m.75276 type:complete len:550 (-) comp13971_c0_seq1:268-1917(-)
MSFPTAGRFAPDVRRSLGEFPLKHTPTCSAGGLEKSSLYPPTWQQGRGEYHPLPEVQTRLVVPEKSRVIFHASEQKPIYVQSQNVQAPSTAISSGHLEREYIDNLRVQVKYLEHEIAYLRQELATSREQILADVRAEAQRHVTEEQAQFEAQWQQQQAQLDRAEEQCEALQRARQRLEQQLTAQNEQREDEKRGFVSKLQQLHKDVEVLEQSCGDKDALLQRQKDDIHAKITELAERDRRLRQVETQMRDAQRACERAKAKSEEQEIEIVEYKSRIEDLEAMLTRMGCDPSKLSHDDGTSSTTSPAELSALHSSYQAENKELRSKLKRAELTIQESQALEERLREDINNLVHDNAKLANQVTELEAECASKTKQLQQEREQHRNTLHQFHQLQTAEQQSSSRSQSLHNSVTGLQEELRRMEAILKNKEVEAATLDQDNYELREGLSHLRRAVEKERQDNVQLKKEKVLLSDHLQELRLAMETNAQNFEDAIHERDLLSAKVKEQQRAISFLKRMQNIRWADLEDMATTVKEFTHQMGTQEHMSSSLFAE